MPLVDAPPPACDFVRTLGVVQIATLLLAAAIVSPSSAVVRGTVRDLAGAPVADVQVFAAGMIAETSTDANGRFELPATAGSSLTLVAFRPGWDATRRTVEIASPVTEVDLILNVVRTTETVSVTAPAPPVLEGTTTFAPLDVVRTAGTQADAFRLIRTLPGVVQVDEGAGLFVRGGDVSEVAVLLDGVPVNHPYRYESPTGGYFGFVDPFLVRGISFSAGGFPARHGNALSAVVDLEGLGMPEGPRASVTAGLAGAALNVARPVGDGWGMRFAANTTFPRLLFAVNDTATRFRRYPSGTDSSASLHRRTPRAETRLFVLQQSDAVGVELEGEGFAGFVDSDTRHRLALVATRAELPAGWQLRGSLGGSSYRSSTTIGVLEQQLTETLLGGRLEVYGGLGSRGGSGELRFGLDGEEPRVEIAGRVPRRAGDFDGHGGVIPFAVNLDERRSGAFAESTWRLRGLFVQTGLRADRYHLLHTTTTSPRLTVSHPLAGGQLRAAWGIYRQSPSPGYFDSSRGAARLPPMRAEHWILGFERGDAGGTLVRVEAYRKRYRQLPLQDDDRGYTAAGHGRAEGVDLFAQRRFPRGEVRASYGYLIARRRWTPIDQRERFALPDEPWEPDFSIPHTAQLVGSWQATEHWTVGWSWRRASGRPYTPIVGAEPTADGGYLPVHGAPNSRRLPRYERIDLSASRPLELAGRPVIAFIGLSNLFDRANFFSYSYSADFSRRQPVKTAAPRSLYFGLSLLDLRRSTDP